VLGDALAHRAHRLQRLSRACGGRCGSRSGGRLGWSGLRLGRRRGRGRLGGRRCRGARLDVLEDVLLGHAAAATGAFDLGDVDVVLGGDARDDRGDELPLSAPVAVRLGLGLRFWLGLLRRGLLSLRRRRFPR
jgi:hypothetical protein